MSIPTFRTSGRIARLPLSTLPPLPQSSKSSVARSLKYGSCTFAHLQTGGGNRAVTIKLWSLPDPPEQAFTLTVASGKGLSASFRRGGHQAIAQEDQSGSRVLSGMTAGSPNATFLQGAARALLRTRKTSREQGNAAAARHSCHSLRLQGFGPGELTQSGQPGHTIGVDGFKLSSPQA